MQGRQHGAHPGQIEILSWQGGLFETRQRTLHLFPLSAEPQRDVGCLLPPVLIPHYSRRQQLLHATAHEQPVTPIWPGILVFRNGPTELQEAFVQRRIPHRHTPGRPNVVPHRAQHGEA